MTSIDAGSNVTFHMGNMYVSFCHKNSAEKVDSEFGHVFFRFSDYFSPFLYSKMSLKLIPLFPNLSIQWGSVPGDLPNRGDAKNTTSNWSNMLKISLNMKFHERLQCVICPKILEDASLAAGPCLTNPTDLPKPTNSESVQLLCFSSDFD